MIGSACYVRCDECYDRMEGIMSDAARRTCHDCGGRALIGDNPHHQKRVRMARERLDRHDLHPTPSGPDLPRAA